MATITTLVGKEHDLNLKETELCLGLPGGSTPKATGKRGFSQTDTLVDLKPNLQSKQHLNQNFKDNVSKHPPKPPAKAQVVGWPPVRSYRKNIILSQKVNSSEDGIENTTNSATNSGAFVKVSMDGAPFVNI